MIKILLPFLFLTSATATAQEPSSSPEVAQSEETKPAPTTDWARVDERMNTTFKASSNVFWPDSLPAFWQCHQPTPVVQFGFFATTGGAITRTAALARQRRSIEERGATVSERGDTRRGRLWGSGPV